MTIRVLPPAEWHKVASHFAAEDVPLPAGDSTILVSEDGDRIVAFLVVQRVPHLEPLWIDPAYRGKVFWPALVSRAEDVLRGGSYYVFAPDAHIARMADLMGLDPLPWKIFRGDV